MLNRQIILVSGLVLAMMASQSAWAQQNAQPDATLDPGGFLPSGAATLHEALITTGTTEFIDSGAANPTTAQISLSSVDDPGVGTGHILRFTCKVEGSKGPETCDVTLYDGGQPIYSVSQQPTARGAWETFSFTLLEAEANNISSAGYANLTVHLTAGISNKAGDGDSAQFSWVELELPAPANTSPSVTTNAITGEPTNNQATVGGNVTSDGNDTLTEVGVYYSTSAGFNPPGEGTRLVDPDPPQPVVGNFTLDLTGLSAGTTYYYQAFAANGIGETIASTQLSFTTKDLPVMLATPTVTIDSPTSATLGGTMTSNGFDPSGMVDCGIEWGTSSGGSYTQVSAGVCTENNAFTAPQLVDLTTGQDHFFRSYATNSIGTGYSNERSFRPVDTPTVDAVVGERTETTAFLGGDIIDTGGDTTLFVGIILDLDNDPINGGTDVPMTVADPFSELVGSLTPGTDYWFVAYAENSGGRGYSSVTPFKTLAGAPTMDSTPTVDSIVGDGAVLGGTISADGGGANLDCGVEWTTVPGEPYESSQSFEGPPDNGTCVEGSPFAVTVSGLTSGQTYYFRAWATSDAGSDVSNEEPFIPQAKPIVISTAPDLGLVTHNSAVLGGDVTSDEGSPVTARGIVWDTVAISADPTSQPTATFVPMGAGLGSFSQEVSLPSGETIFFEAYATNSAGTAYSNNGRFFDTLTEPTIQATNATITRFAGRSMRISWTRGNGDGSIVVIRETGTTSSGPPVDGDDYVGNPDFSQTTPPPQLNPGGNGNFVVHKGPENSVWVTRLNLNTSYSIAIYEYAGASPDYVQSTPAEVTQPTSTLAVHNEDLRVNCDDCHNHGSFNARDAELSAICETCHNPDGTNEARFKTEFANHRPPTDNLDIDFVDCGMCHEVHNFNANDTTESYHSVDEVPVINKSFLRANVDKYVSTATPPAYLPDTDQPYRAGPPEILADTPDRAVEGGVEAVEPSTPTQARGYCQVCHTLTKYHRSTNLTGGLGSNQAHDGINNNSGQGTEVNCGECHEHNNNFSGVGGSQTCIECHQSGQPPRPIITTQFDLLSSHMPNGSGVVTQPDCEVCHDQTGHYGDQIVGVVDADTGAIYNQPDAGPSNTTEPLQGEAFEPHCLSCHADGVASRLPDDDGGVTPQTKTSPFTNSPAPPIIGQVDLPPPLVGVVNTWDEPTAAHNRGTPIMSCVGGCHGSGHGSAELSLLAPITSEPGVVADASVFCMNCHSSGGYSSLDVRSVFDPAIAGDGYRTQRDRGGALVNQRHDVFVSDQEYSGGAAPDTVTSIACADCHSPHDDSSDFPVAVNPETGVWLGTYNDGGYSPANGADPTFGAGATEPDYIEFCNACHDGVGGTAQGGTSVLSPNLEQIGGVGGTYESDFHGYGFGGTGGNGFLKPPFQVDTEYAPMQCTTCHGAHGGGNIYNLRSSITVGGQQMSVGGWTGDGIGELSGTTYDMKTANDGVTQDDLQWGGFCSFCHNMQQHGLDETKTCNTGHVHGGGKM